jgi:hypothetical protein
LRIEIYKISEQGLKKNFTAELAERAEEKQSRKKDLVKLLFKTVTSVFCHLCGLSVLA